MKRIIRRLWIPAALAAGVVLWCLIPVSSPSPCPPSGPTLREAAAASSAPVNQLRKTLAVPPALSPGAEAPGIHLRSRRIGISANSNVAGAPVHERPSARGWPWMVCFDGPVLDEWKQQLIGDGASIRASLPRHALLLEVPDSLRTRLTAFPHVIWNGEYRPTDKIQPLLAALSKEEPDLAVPVSIQTFAPEDTALLTQALKQAGASDIRSTAARRWGILRAVLPASDAVMLAELPEVQWVEHYQLPKVLNDAARAPDRLNIDTVQEDHGLDGAGQIVAIADTGLDTGNTNTLHPDLAGRVLHVFDTGRLTNWSDTYYHGTHVAGSVLGSGAASSGQYRGAAPAASLVFQSFMDGNNSLVAPDDLNDLYEPPYGLDARIHSDSWGSEVNGEYNTDAMTTDEFIWDHDDMLIVYAAGNAGIDEDRDGIVDPSSLDAPGSAKNVLTVGASESGRESGTGGLTARTYGSAWPIDYRAEPIWSDLISSSPDGGPQGIVAFSSRGPAQDGRTKPDLVAPGSDIVSVRSRASDDTGWGVADNTNYCFMGGTSMATPLIAGAGTLVRQYCTDTLGMDAPSAALLKAALAGGARSLTPGQYGTNEYREVPPRPRPNTVEGWGQADVGRTLFPSGGLSAVLIDESTGLATAESNAVSFAVTGSAPLTVAMAYSDYPSALSASINLVNDLDLLLLDPNGIPHYPNGLDTADSLNNLEGIDVDAPAAGKWTLVVSGTDVPQGPQPYGLYLRGAVRMAVNIEHTPLENTWLTNQDLEVSAEITCPGPFDTNSVSLVWVTSTDPGGFTTTPMTTTNGSRFAAVLPARPPGSTYWYYISAGPAEAPTCHPANAPIYLHEFSILPPLTLTVSGSPSDCCTTDPDYGVHTFTSNETLRAGASYPVVGTNGWRTACIGWTGSGSVPASGTTDFVDFTLSENSSVTWLWQQQVSLTHTSSPYGAIQLTTWHETNSVTDSLIAPESHLFNQVPMTFAGWEVDGARWPDDTSPSRRQATRIPMPAPRIATATYLPTDRDADDSGLPDWFEMRYFGEDGRDPYGDPDGDGYENELEAADHTDPLDALSIPAPPVIRHVPLDNPANTPAPWSIAATITDNTAVASATLQWQRNGGLVRSLSMNNLPSGSDTYQVELPSPARDGDVITYSLQALDTAGIQAQSTTWTVSVQYARITCAPDSFSAEGLAGTETNLLLQISNAGSLPLQVELEVGSIGWADDMESGTNGWTHPDGNSVWHLSTQASVSPDHAWYCGKDSTLTYDNSTHAALATPSVRLGAVSPRLDFMHRTGFELDNDEFPDSIHYWDSGVLEISDDGGLTWTALVPEGGYPGLVTSNSMSPFDPDTPCFANTDGWEPVGVDLSAYANQIVQVRFRFGADLYVVAEGWRIDDVVFSPHTLTEGWLTLSETNLTVTNGVSGNIVLTLDTTLLEPMENAHLALRIHHNDPEIESPLVIPVSLQNLTRRVTVSTSGSGTAEPAGVTLLAPDDPFQVDFTASDGSFIADIRSNSIPLPLPDIVFSNSLSWAAVESNLSLHAVFAPVLSSDAVPTNWLSSYGLTQRNWMAEASLDPDGDALLTWQEYELGSNPTNPADARLVVSFVPDSPPHTNWHLTWHAFTNEGAVYRILSTTNLTEGFTPWTNLPAAPPVMTSPPLAPEDRFFGIVMP